MNQGNAAAPQRREADQGKVLALIPARGGSKGLPLKNIRPLHGLPLIAYSIRVARQCRLVDRVVVSTDDERIAAVAREHGAEVPFLRPAELATDTALLGAALDHALKTLAREGYVPCATAVLYPTHPFRTAATVDFLADKLAQGYSPVRVQQAVDCRHRRFAALGPDGRIRPMTPREQRFGCAEAGYSVNSGFFEGSAQRAAARPFVYTLGNPLACVDIDTEADLLLARHILEQGLFDFAGGLL